MRWVRTLKCSSPPSSQSWRRCAQAATGSARDGPFPAARDTGHRARRVRSPPEDTQDVRGDRTRLQLQAHGARPSREPLDPQGKERVTGRRADLFLQGQGRPGHRPPIRPHRGNDAERLREQGTQTAGEARLVRRGLALRRAPAREIPVVLPVGRRGLRRPQRRG